MERGKYEVVERTELLEHRFWPETGFNSLHVLLAVKAGSVLLPFHALVTFPEPNCYTLQLSDTEHIELGPAILRFTNHSCEPNLFYNTSSLEAEVIKDMQPGDEVCFFYPSTEWHMDVPFDCMCGKPSCIGRIQGAQHATKDVLSKYRVNAHIQSKLERSAV